MNETRRCEEEGPLRPCLGADAPCARGGEGTAVAGVGSGVGTRGAASGGGSVGEVSNGVARGGEDVPPTAVTAADGPQGPVGAGERR